MNNHILVGIAQYALIFNDKKEFLILQFGDLNASDESYRWVLPGGRVNKGEKNLIDSLHREIKEETNLKVEILFPFISELSNHSGVLTHKSCYICKYILGNIVVGNDNIINYKWITHDKARDHLFIGAHGNKMFKKFIDDSKKFLNFL